MYVCNVCMIHTFMYVYVCMYVHVLRTTVGTTYMCVHVVHTCMMYVVHVQGKRVVLVV